MKMIWVVRRFRLDVLPDEHHVHKLIASSHVLPLHLKDSAFTKTKQFMA